MRSIFRASWEELVFEDVRAFLEEQRADEGVTWEAKGPDPKRDDQLDAHLIRRAVCGLANTMGGYVLIGARWHKESLKWKLPGVVFDVPEPTTWLDDLLRGSLRPVPRLAIKVWELEEDGRAVGVVEVEPVAVPPCILSGGQVYERVSGKTIPVSDPLVLTRLIERGKAARHRAESLSERPLQERLSNRSHVREDERLRVLLGLGAVSYEPDISKRLFAEGAADEIRRLVDANLRPARHHESRGVRLTVQQDRICTLSRGFGPEMDGDRDWFVSIGWDGSVAIKCMGNDEDLGLEVLFEDIVLPAWETAAALIAMLGGSGDCRITLEFSGGELAGSCVLHAGHTGWIQKIVAPRRIARWAPDGRPNDDLVASVKRELLRGLGFPAWEPG
jgi:hypothetical protein